MKLPRDIIDLPQSITLERNHRAIVAVAEELGTFECADGHITVGDAEGIAEFSPITVRSGAYRVVVYQWQHPQQRLVNVALLAACADTSRGRVKHILVRQSFAPHIADLPVDFASVAVKIGNRTVRVQSGLGDGVYPVYVRKPFLRAANLVMVDFKIWELGKVVLLPGQEMDEYQMVVKAKA